MQPDFESFSTEEIEMQFELYEARKQGAHIDAIKFPSVEHKQESINYAIHPDLVNNITFMEHQYDFSELLKLHVFSVGKLLFLAGQPS